ncbi:hypothetical protein NEF87_000405 [Candidatus Lokiarchaeum ossiferum]|uniref:Uncharacterized protein n=1 Tax=Candidatus Lokiarchaeum ossiferum TaxID=2951803 RepID=A0ABY6HL48_9ARCH|nr:hypothetical protein NEF87_000405 [Candidatus Lokiarchaeum sp. B-35]
MKHIWIINKFSSTNLLYRNYSDFSIDPDLVSGLLTALNSFSEVELKAHGISSIHMGGLKWVYSDQKEMHLMLIAADKIEAQTEVLRARLEVIFKMFIEKYGIIPEQMEKTLIDSVRFDDFAEELDLLKAQWIQAEEIITGGAAKIFDLLGVFQQIYSAFNNIIRLNFFQADYDNTVIEIKMILENMKGTPEFKKYPELSKIKFDKYGWDVINLNPTNLDEKVLARILIMLTLHLNNILTTKLSRSSKYNAYSKEIFPLLLEKYDLLVSLDILHTLMRVFL